MIDRLHKAVTVAIWCLIATLVPCGLFGPIIVVFVKYNPAIAVGTFVVGVCFAFFFGRMMGKDLGVWP